jgi:hypothetical protein
MMAVVLDPGGAPDHIPRQIGPRKNGPRENGCPTIGRAIMGRATIGVHVAQHGW